MRFEIKIQTSLEHPQPVLCVLLFTRKDEDYLNGCEDGIYNCSSTISEDKKQLLATIEQCVNGCLQTYADEMEEVIKEIIKKNQPKLDEFMTMCFEKEIMDGCVSDTPLGMAEEIE